MYLSTSKDKRFNAIDLDPYGCPSKFLDGAVQSIEDGGLLLVTATDMAVLAGNTPESCYLKYGAISLKSKACHEMVSAFVKFHSELRRNHFTYFNFRQLEFY